MFLYPVFQSPRTSITLTASPAVKVPNNSYALVLTSAQTTGLFFNVASSQWELRNAENPTHTFPYAGGYSTPGAIIAASVANPGLTAGDGSTGYIKVGAKTFSNSGGSNNITFGSGIYLNGGALTSQNSSATYLTLATLYNNATANTANGSAISFDVKRTTGGQTPAARIIGTLTDIGDSTYKGAIIFQVNNQGTTVEAGRFDYRGYLGLNCTPAYRLDILGSDNETVGRVKINAAQADITAADTFISFDSSSGVEGSITGTTGQAGVISYNSFTGSHWAQSDTIEAMPQERTVTKIVRHMVGAVFSRNEDGSIRVNENGEEIILEPERLIEREEEETVTVYISDVPAGSVLVAVDEMSEWEGEVCDYLPKVEVSSVSMDKRVYGVYGGHDRDGDILAIGLGAGKILVCDEGGGIEPGDFLCTSSIPGYAMKYSGSDMRYVVAKARQSMSGASGLIAATLLAG